jgi:hypothetical protein
MNEHKTADSNTLEVRTEAIAMSIGIAEGDMESLRPDLNGFRLKSPASPYIYLIDEGHRRCIPDPETYNNLFRDWGGIIVDINVIEILEGPPISHGAILSKPYNTGPVYLVDKGVKRFITSPEVMDKYHFAWNRIYVVPSILLESIQNGPSIT